MRPPPRRPSGSSPLSWLLILGALALMLALPLLGAWVASTLVIHQGASERWAIAAGLGLGLGLPVVWEVLSQPRHQPGGTRPKRWLRLRTRLLLRTWAVNLLFLGGALLLSPRGVFTALSTRGDWMLPRNRTPHVQLTRRVLFAAADGVEWAYVLATENPYRDQLIAPAPRPPPPTNRPPPEPSESASEPEAPSGPAQPSSEPIASEPPPAEPPTTEQPLPSTEEKDPLLDGDSDVVLSWKPEPRPSEPTPAPAEPQAVAAVVPKWQGVAPQAPPEPGRTGGASYPFPAQLHPRIASMPPEVEKDLVSVAKYLVKEERDPFQRIKVLHDYVADRVAYDAVAYRTMNIPPQPPEAVFKKRLAVCAGYANLFAAMGQAVGEEIVTISGEAITPAKEKELEAHAWNAVSIKGQWYLVDVTWNAGHVSGDVFGRNYRTKYLFMPPHEFLRDHIPDEPGWQLLDEPLARGEVLRRARAYAQAPASRAPPEPRTDSAPGESREWQGISILKPSRRREEVRGRFNVELDNPQGLPAQVSLLNVQDGSQEPCLSQYGGASYACTVLSRGLYRIQVFVGPQTPPQLMAQLEVTGM